MNGSSGTLTVLTNSGGGRFGSNATYTVTGTTLTVAAADLNGDSQVDLICGTSYPGAVTVLTNDGNARFVLSSSLSITGRAYSVAAADVNGDGKLDLISVNAVRDAGALYIFTNNGAGGFALSSSPGVGSDPFAVVAADVNADGWVDLICANYYANTLSVLTNNGSGTFALACTPGVGSWPISLAAADANGDGTIDLVSANSLNGEGGNSLSVLTNNGNASFAPASTLAVGRNPCAVMAEDVNADGKIDLISANFVDNTLTVLTNTGLGSFALATTCAVDVNPRGAAAADFNEDGHMDFATANFTARTLSVVINIPTLVITRLPNGLVVSWRSCWTNWTLLQTTDPEMRNWSTSVGVANDGTNRSLTIPSPTNTQLFRLSLP